MPTPEYVPIRRSNYADRAAEAAAAGTPDPEARWRVAGEATKLAPLQRIQARHDALAGALDDYARFGPQTLAGRPADHIRGELALIERDVATLRAAHEAAEALHDGYVRQYREWEDAMAKAKNDPNDDAPQLTTDGSPHPLQEGGYEPEEDMQLPGNVSDVEALKEGKATHAQMAAIGKADAAATRGQEPTKADGPVNPPAATVEPAAAKAAQQQQAQAAAKAEPAKDAGKGGKK